MRVRVFRREGNNQYYFQFLRDDGQVILNSEGYTTETARDNGVQSVINNSVIADRYEAHTNDAGGFYFILKAGNNQEIGRSVTFRNAEGRDDAMSLMQGEAAGVEGGSIATAATVEANIKPYKASGKEDDYKPLNFYETRITGISDGFDSFSEGDKHYFTYNLGGNVFLISEGYTSTAARDNGIQSVSNNMNIEARYQRQQHPNGNFFFNLRAGNNREIATSRWFDNQGEMDSAITRMVAGIGLGGRRAEEVIQLEAAKRDANMTIAAAAAKKEEGPKKRRKKATGEKKPKKEKQYVANGNYHFNEVTYDIFKSGNDRYYFTFKNSEGKTLFLNANVRGFETQEEAQAMVDQIMLYAPYEENFDGKQAKNGKYYFYIKGEDGKNIGKSFFYGAAEDMQSSASLFLGNEAQIAELSESRNVGDGDTTAATNKNIDEYLARKAYASDEDGFNKFKNDENGEFYFGYNHGGKTYLRSEGYTTEKARGNGIESAIKNAPIDERWKTMKNDDDGMWYYSLKAGNNQEIARSCGYESEAVMNSDWAWIRGDESTLGAGAQYIGGVWYSGDWLRRKKEEEAVALALKQTEEAAAKKAIEEAEFKEAAKNIDEYLECSAYEGIQDGFHKFKHDNGEYYFSYIGDGKILLRSEGYATEKARDNCIESVIKNAAIDERWKTMKNDDDGMWYYSLRAGNNQEIARSCGYESEAAMNSGWAWIRGENSSLGLATALAATQAIPKVVKNVNKEDDYLPCKAYEGHNVNDKINNVAFFKGEDGQYYFALYDEDGKVRLRSEGFKTAQDRDQELSGVVRLKDNDDFYKRIEKGKYYMDILYDETGREVSRSCLKNAEEEKAAAAAVAATAAAVALAATRRQEEEAAAAPIALKQEEVATAATAIAARESVVTTTKTAVVRNSEEGDGTFGWWPWLLLPLLLAGALYFSKGCYGCGGDATLPTPMDVSAVMQKVTPVDRITPPPPTTSASGNASGTSDCAAMNLPENGRAQVLTRLGRNPEFGNAHDLTGPQFLGRLRNRYATETVDKKFLDKLFTCMGYENGFADATADMFTVVTVPNGKTGNMGYGKNHGTAYTTLNAKDAKDLEAFRVQAANGCDIHFMKTSGNHFYFCN